MDTSNSDTSGIAITTQSKSKGTLWSRLFHRKSPAPNCDATIRAISNPVLGDKTTSGNSVTLPFEQYKKLSEKARKTQELETRLLEIEVAHEAAIKSLENVDKLHFSTSTSKTAYGPRFLGPEFQKLLPEDRGRRILDNLQEVRLQIERLKVDMSISRKLLESEIWSTTPKTM